MSAITAVVTALMSSFSRLISTLSLMPCLCVFLSKRVYQSALWGCFMMLSLIIFSPKSTEVLSLLPPINHQQSNNSDNSNTFLQSSHVSCYISVKTLTFDQARCGCHNPSSGRQSIQETIGPEAL
ncbi:hypothetical protein BDR26DRAFT_870513 [Obelidium mucronatum]|nr:hypothetical protein BDR26DRAFT_870513 [Obelidium mucronatum]